MSNEGVLRARAREFIESGKLPQRLPSRTWGGPGSGAQCTLCGITIHSHEIDMEYDHPDGIDGETVQHFHTRCLVLVEDEVRRFAQASDGMSDRRPSRAGGDGQRGRGR
jgi:hypothetical protein